MVGLSTSSTINIETCHPHKPCYKRISFPYDCSAGSEVSKMARTWVAATSNDALPSKHNTNRNPPSVNTDGASTAAQLTPPYSPTRHGSQMNRPMNQMSTWETQPQNSLMPPRVTCQTSLSQAHPTPPAPVAQMTPRKNSFQGRSMVKKTFTEQLPLESRRPAIDPSSHCQARPQMAPQPLQLPCSPRTPTVRMCSSSNLQLSNPNASAARKAPTDVDGMTMPASTPIALVKNHPSLATSTGINPAKKRRTSPEVDERACKSSKWKPPEGTSVKIHESPKSGNSHQLTQVPPQKGNDTKGLVRQLTKCSEDPRLFTIRPSSTAPYYKTDATKASHSGHLQACVNEEAHPHTKSHLVCAECRLSAAQKIQAVQHKLLTGNLWPLCTTCAGSHMAAVKASGRFLGCSCDQQWLCYLCRTNLLEVRQDKAHAEVDFRKDILGIGRPLDGIETLTTGFRCRCLKPLGLGGDHLLCVGCDGVFPLKWTWADVCKIAATHCKRSIQWT